MSTGKRAARVALVLMFSVLFAGGADARGKGGGSHGGGAGGPDPERMLRMMDDNGDGKISREEWRREESEFDEVDTDKDGFVSQDELTAFLVSVFDPAHNPMHPAAPRAVQEKAGLIATGLEAVFPPGAGCPVVTSPFGVTTRYDGSVRNSNANHSFHNGMDIGAPIGTPLIAIADGEVVHSYTGGTLVGHQIILRHTPEDTGLPFHVYSKYKHFDRLPDLEVGQRVKMGDVLGPSGNSGTTGGYYGAAGYAHLHMSIYVSDDPGYRTFRPSVFPKAVRFMDPMAIYLPAAARRAENHAVAALPDADKKVRVPYIGADGAVHPAGARIVWPFKCKGS